MWANSWRIATSISRWLSSSAARPETKSRGRQTPPTSSAGAGPETSNAGTPTSVLSCREFAAHDARKRDAQRHENPTEADALFSRVRFEVEKGWHSNQQHNRRRTKQRQHTHCKQRSSVEPLSEGPPRNRHN